MRPPTRLAATAVVAGLPLLAAACGGGSASTPAATASSAGATTSATGCSRQLPPKAAVTRKFATEPAMTISPSRTYLATFDTTCGTFVVRLDPRAAPHTVNSFVFLARHRFFDGLTFHRVVRDFVIQGGDPAGNGTGGPGYTLPDELPRTPYRIGDLVMANTGQPHTSGSQFFVVSGAQGTRLPLSYSRFGHVVRGLAAVERINALGANPPPADPTQQVPSQPVAIRSVTVRVR